MKNYVLNVTLFDVIIFPSFKLPILIKIILLKLKIEK